MASGLFSILITLGQHHQNATHTSHIGAASKTYNGHSFANKYPSYPIKYSTTRKTLLSKIKMLVKYNIQITLNHSLPCTKLSLVGFLLIRAWNTILVTKNSPNEVICTNSPATIIPSPIFLVDALNVKPAELPWIMNDAQSPSKKALVSQLTRMGERCSAWRKRIMRPSVMYIDAAKSAGARRMNRFCSRYGRSSDVRSRAGMRSMYPITSTSWY